MIETPEITAYVDGTHAITDQASGARYALRSDDEALLDAYTSQRASIFGTPVPSYEDGDIGGGPLLLSITQVEPTTGSTATGEEVVRFDLFG